MSRGDPILNSCVTGDAGYYGEGEVDDLVGRRVESLRNPLVRVAGAGLLGGWEYAPNRTDADAPAAQVAFVSDDIDVDWARAVGAGAAIVKPPEAKPWGQTAGYLRDCNGVIVELATRSPRDVI